MSWALQVTCVVTAAACLGAGCLLAGGEHSARPVAAGKMAVGATVSLAAYDYVDNNGSLNRVRLVNPVPELSLRRGVGDDLDIGGRLALGQLAVGADLRYRFVRRDALHIAVAPTVAIQNLRVMSGGLARVPIVATVEASERLAVNGSLFVLASRYTTPDPNEAGSDFGVFQGTQVAAGGALSVDIDAGRIRLRPGIELTRYLIGSEDAGFEPFTAVNGFVHLGYSL